MEWETTGRAAPYSGRPRPTIPVCPVLRTTAVDSIRTRTGSRPEPDSTSNGDSHDSHRPQTRSPRTRRHAFRPRLDALEERQLLTAGALDTAFNAPNGYVLTGFTKKGTSGTQGTAYDVQIQSDGKILAGGGAFGEFALARYTSGAPVIRYSVPAGRS